MQARILIADDQPDVLRALCLLLKGQGYTTETATSPAELLQAVGREEFDVLLMDLNYARDTTSGREGLDLLTHLKAMQSVPPIVVMTGWATVNIAVEALRHGVSDFVEKPWSNSQLLEVLRKHVTLGRERRELARRAEQETQTQKVIASQLREQEHEIAEARAIQEGLLPKEIPQLPGYEIAGVNIPAGQVSGDYYDYIPIAANRFGIAIADVCGKGVPASLIMAMCRSVLRSVAPSSSSAARVLHQVNRQLYPDIREDMFISMAYLILEKGSENLLLARAGHDAPLLYRTATRSVEKVNPPGMALGIDSGGVFDRVTGDFTVRLESGDCLILYTDGVTEALDSNGIEFGIARLIEVIQGSADESAQAVVVQVTEKVRSFVGSQPQNDDITLVAIRKV